LPSKGNLEAFESEKIINVFDNNILNIFNDADISIANLEGCFYDGNFPGIVKQGPCLKASKKSFEGYKKLNLTAVGMANNHCLDYGQEGLDSTLALLEKNKISYFGAGANIKCAKKPLIISKEGYKVGFIGIAEHEYTIATDTTCGAASFDELYTLDDIEETKTKVDFLVVLYHGSKEYYRYAIPYVQKRCRRFIEKGADLVLCQHSHCIGCQEMYQSGIIIYGQGNFCFDEEVTEYTKDGLLVKVELPQKRVDIIPIVNEGVRVRFANEHEKKVILQEFNKRSEQIKIPGFVDKEYQKFSDSMIPLYDRWGSGKLGYALRKFHFNRLYKKLFSSTYDVDMLNVLQCEAHRDLYIKALGDRLNSQNN